MTLFDAVHVPVVTLDVFTYIVQVIVLEIPIFAGMVIKK